MVRTQYLQSYLDEFSYRFNRRHMIDQVFDYCVAAMVNALNGLTGMLLAKLLSLKI